MPTPNEYGMYEPTETIELPVPAPQKAMIKLVDDGYYWLVGIHVIGKHRHGKITTPNVHSVRYRTREGAIQAGLREIREYIPEAKLPVFKQEALFDDA